MKESRLSDAERLARTLLDTPVADQACRASLGAQLATVLLRALRAQRASLEDGVREQGASLPAHPGDPAWGP